MRAPRAEPHALGGIGAGNVEAVCLLGLARNRRAARTARAARHTQIIEGAPVADDGEPLPDLPALPEPAPSLARPDAPEVVSTPSTLSGPVRCGDVIGDDRPPILCDGLRVGARHVAASVDPAARPGGHDLQHRRGAREKARAGPGTGIVERAHNASEGARRQRLFGLLGFGAGVRYAKSPRMKDGRRSDRT